jgi:photosystem II stability/assembly factor-like uncharacterized protein
MRRIAFAALGGLLVSLSPASPLRAQARGPGLHGSIPDQAVLSDLRLRAIGPAAMSGRISDIAVAAMPGERLGRVIYVASAAGGVWKSANGGKSWNAIFEDQPVASIGDVTVAPSNPAIVWVGSGESNNLRSSSWGNGIYKSTDGGETWTHVGLRTSQHVPRILVHPANPDIVYVAAMGPLWASGGERGLYKTTDAGRTWNRVLSINETTGITDAVFDPTNPDVIYAAAMQRERKAWSFVSGGPASGIYKTNDAGATWHKLERGLPAGDKGRIGLDVSLSQPRTVYAYVNAQEGGVFRSDDGGESWTRQSNISSLPWFTGQVRVDPRNPDRVYHIGQALSVSTDGGKNWSRIANQTHADHHAMWINPTDPNHMAIGNDGGFYISYDMGRSWEFAENLPVSTFYSIGVDMRDPYRVYGGLQDNGSWGVPSRTRERTGIANADWVNVGGGDGFYTVIDPSDPLTMYSESQNGALQRVDLPTDERKSIRPSGAPGEQLRWNWSSPLVISRYDNRKLYFGANYLFMSPDRGDGWTKLGGDLTRQLDRDTLPIMGLRAAGGFGRHDGTAPYGNITSISESPVTRGLLWVGTDDGLVQVTRDDGRTWTRIDRFPGVPDLTYVSHVEASAAAEGTVYATFDGHRTNDFRPYVLKSTDFGRTWASITSNLPEGSLQVVREHPRNPDLLFAGSEFGLFASTNGGASWTPMRNNFPTVAVHDIVIHPRDNDLVVGTHGRGLYILDDLTPLQRLAAQGSAAAAVFQPPAATVFNRSAGPSAPGDREFFGENPAAGASLTYVVNRSLGTGARATLALVDGSGEVVRELEADAAPGVHRLAWDLRFTPPAGEPERRRAPAGEEEEAPVFFGGGAQGPLAPAGTYRVQLRVTPAGGAASTVAESTLQVRRDPEVRLTEAEWADLYDWRLRAWRAQKDANALVRRLDEAKAQLAQARTRVDSSSAAAGQARQAGAAIDSVLLAVRGAQPAGGRGAGFGGGGGGGGGAQPLLTRLNGAATGIGGLHFAVTAAQKETISSAVQQLAARTAAANAAIERAQTARRALGG